MADVSIGIAGTTVSFTIADQDAGRILAAYTAFFTTPGEDGTPTVPSPQEAVVEIAKSVVAGLAQNAIRYEQEQAAKSAADAVPPIDATINPAP